MIEFTQWFNNSRNNFTKKWAILGKGPTLSVYSSFTNDFHSIGLNHVVLNHAVDILHAIDLEVIIDCQDILDKQCNYVFMPFIPNIGFRSGGRSLNDFFGSIPILEKLSNENRLIWYNLRIGKETRAHPTISSPPIEVQYFSSEAALGLLGNMGIRDVRSFGIDGGSSYAKEFNHLRKKHLLANGRTSFDEQFSRLEKIASSFSMDYQPMTKPMKVYIGTDESQIIAAKVLEHSIRKHATRPVQVTHMLNLPYPKITNPAVRPGTNFSFTRFMIPELSGFDGKAMYCDADMLVFGDISTLWDIDFGKQTVLCTRQDYIPEIWKENPAFTPGRQMSVLLLDCARLDWHINRIIDQLNIGRITYKDLMTDICIEPKNNLRDDLPPSWNCLEHYEPDSTKLLHYTNVPTQPWKFSANPLSHLWEEAFSDAVRDGAVSIEDVSESVRKGDVRYELLEMAIASTPESSESPETNPLRACQLQLLGAIADLRKKDEELTQLRRQSSGGTLAKILRKLRRKLKSRNT